MDRISTLGSFNFVRSLARSLGSGHYRLFNWLSGGGHEKELKAARKQFSPRVQMTSASNWTKVN